jgi:succinate-acetate transporter protein
MAVGNTFGATALSSYGGFWIAYAIMLTPNWNIVGKGGPYQPVDQAGNVTSNMSDSALGLFLTGWFIFTTILLLCTLRSTVMFFMLFFTLDLAFLMLACGHYAKDNGVTDAALKLTQAGGGFGMLAAFLAWYNAFAGIADSRYVTPLVLVLFYAPLVFCPKPS